MAAGEERAALEEYLRERGLKMTRPRETVLEVFLALERHVTAEELLALARRVEPGIGQATVFRTIRLLADAGIAREARSDDGAKSYEHAYRHEHHDHLVCQGCGGIVEFRDAAIERAQEAVYRRHGFAPSSHRLELRGYCPACAKKLKRG
jgi:Fur family transcriptional regulator, ferric uptake regulator